MMSSWRVLHVVMSGSADHTERLLLDTVEPWAAAALDAGSIRSWYLIRPPRDLETGDAVVKLRFQDIGDDQLGELRAQILCHGVQSAGERPFAPEESRFGGADGMAVALAQFPGATKVAMATIRSTPTHDERLTAAAELLLVSVWAMGGDSEAAIEWLRQYAAAQAGPGVKPAADVLRAQADAAACAGHESRWPRHVDTVRSRMSRSDSRLGQWHGLMSATWSALSDLDARSRLTMPAVLVFSNLIQMTHNRLGLSSQANSYLGYLLALALERSPSSSRAVDGSQAARRG